MTLLRFYPNKDLSLLRVVHALITVVSDPTKACASEGELQLQGTEGWLSSTQYPTLSDCFLQVGLMQLWSNLS